MPLEYTFNNKNLENPFVLVQDCIDLTSIEWRWQWRGGEVAWVRWLFTFLSITASYCIAAVPVVWPCSLSQLLHSNWCRYKEASQLWHSAKEIIILQMPVQLSKKVNTKENLDQRCIWKLWTWLDIECSICASMDKMSFKWRSVESLEMGMSVERGAGGGGGVC